MPAMNAAEWRRWHRQRGESYRWLKGIPVPEGTPGREQNGRLYVEVALDPAIRGMFHNTTVDMEDAEFGLIRKGATAFSVMPDETPMARLDRVILTQREMLVREVVSNGTLAQPYVAAVVEIRQGTTVYARDTDYTVTGRTINWTGAAPSGAYSVEYTFNPVFVVVPQSDQLPRPDRYGVLMPQRGALMLWNPS